MEVETLSTFLPLLLFFTMGLIALALFAFWIWMLIDCLKYEPPEGNDKLVWVFVILFINWLGALIYYFVRRRHRPPPALAPETSEEQRQL